MENGLQVDVRLLEKGNFGAALLYFTGSKEHNVKLRGRANEMGYTLNEYSLATLKAEKPVAGRSEEEIYERLKLDYIPPELRENTGEIEAAEKHRLPKLVELKLASGMTNPGRLKDLGDVQELIRTLGLRRELADDLDPYVREKYRELWDAVQASSAEEESSSP